MVEVIGQLMNTTVTLVMYILSAEKTMGLLISLAKACQAVNQGDNNLKSDNGWSTYLFPA